MTRSALPAVVVAALGIFSAAVFPMACQSGGIGDPCTPEDEYDPEFPGFKLTQEFIESRSFQCETRLCLVNHFQGRVSCPLGQNAPKVCLKGQGCGDGEKCVPAAVDAPSCEENGDCTAYGGKCTSNKFCGCTDKCPKEGYECVEGQCTKSVCFKNECQSEADTDNAGAADKACCIPGSKTPVAQPVCGQCGKDTIRGAENSVYCSCRCAPPEGKADAPENKNAKFCDCPEGFVCEPIREDIGIGDKLLAGSYCIKTNTVFQDTKECGPVKGARPLGCEGVQAN